VKEAPKSFHFLGICGTAMGAVAVALQERGFKVTGSDENVYPPMSSFLENKGIALLEDYRAENIPADADVVVIGNAMTRGNPETTLSVVARGAQEFFPARPPQSRGHRNAR
jgi:UDP-N-acetylmuramate: L-alanyl-gamma-D-glutamyl-meso-diaminopimelate ligase